MHCYRRTTVLKFSYENPQTQDVFFQPVKKRSIIKINNKQCVGLSSQVNIGSRRGREQDVNTTGMIICTKRNHQLFRKY